MKQKTEIDFSTGLSCPIPKSDYEHVLLAHGGGGTLSHQLISKLFFSQFDNEFLNEQHDSAVFNIDKSRIAFTTDSYVVRPIFFPGGNIGELAINGTVNDLVVAGAKPIYISIGFIIEEGLLIEDLWEIVLSMKVAARKSGVKIVTGDTKVVDKGKGDKIFINTSGIGIINEGINISPNGPKLGDNVVGSLTDLSVNGTGIPIPFSGSNENTSPPGINLLTSKYNGISSPRSEANGVLIAVLGKKGIPNIL